MNSLAQQLAEVLEECLIYIEVHDDGASGIMERARQALAAYMEAHPTPTTPCTPSSQDPN